MNIAPLHRDHPTFRSAVASREAGEDGLASGFSGGLLGANHASTVSSERAWLCKLR